MPQTDIFMTRDDSERFVAFLLRHGCTLVADIDYPRTEYLAISSLVEYTTAYERYDAVHWLAVCPAWSPEPLQFGSFDRRGETHYYVEQKVGGPTLDLFAPRTYDSPNGTVLPHGFIAYHSRYWSSLASEERRAPACLKQLYRDCVALARVGSSVVEAPQRRYLIASEAVRALEEGSVLGPPFFREG